MNTKHKRITLLVAPLIATTTLVSALMLSASAMAEKIGEVKTSGMFVKDSISIHSFSDPTIKGVACHVTAVNKALSLNDPTDSSIACRQVSKSIQGDYEKPKKNLFSKKKNLFFKKMQVDRFYDRTNNTLVYIAYTKKMSGENASHSISTVPLYGVKQ